MKERISELEKQTPDYNEELLSAIENSGYEFTEGELNKAIKILKEAGKVTTSALMVGLKICYAKATKILEILEERGLLARLIWLIREESLLIKILKKLYKNFKVLKLKYEL